LGGNGRDYKNCERLARLQPKHALRTRQQKADKLLDYMPLHQLALEEVTHKNVQVQSAVKTTMLGYKMLMRRK